MKKETDLRLILDRINLKLSVIFAIPDEDQGIDKGIEIKQ